MNTTPASASTVDSTFAAFAARRPDYTPWCGFVVKDGGAVYTLSPSDRPDLPGTHRLTGNHGTTYGYWTEATGTPVRVRREGWSGTKGVLGTFDTRDTPNPTNDDPTMRVKGWAVISTLDTV